MTTTSSSALAIQKPRTLSLILTPAASPPLLQTQVLNMQEKRVSEAMCPRVDVEALDKKSSLGQLQVWIGAGSA